MKALVLFFAAFTAISAQADCILNIEVQSGSDNQYHSEEDAIEARLAKTLRRKGFEVQTSLNQSKEATNSVIFDLTGKEVSGYRYELYQDTGISLKDSILEDIRLPNGGVIMRSHINGVDTSDSKNIYIGSMSDLDYVDFANSLIRKLPDCKE